MKIRSEIMGDGSYGIRAKTPGENVRVWFCGRGYAARNGVFQDACAHRTREEARNCNRPVGELGAMVSGWRHPSVPR